MTKAILGVIGGSGIYDLPGLENVREEHVEGTVGRSLRAAAHRRDGGAADRVPAAA